MAFIFIDRRQAEKNKSSSNRQKLIKRIKGFIKNAVPTMLGASGVSHITTSGGIANNPIKIARNALEEPWFAYAQGGEQLVIIPGNTTYNRGDKISIESEDETAGKSASTGAGTGEGGEDDFIINVAANEFLDLFFEDCELPNLDTEKVVEQLENKMSHAGFSTQGTPSQLSIVRTYKNAIGRRRALGHPYRVEIDELESEMATIYEDSALHKEETDVEQKWATRLNEIEERLTVLYRKIAAVAGFDKVDLRYRKKEAHPLKSVDAVLIMVMDISGSMGQEEKTIARRWFALLYAFIKRRYITTDLIFIAHTDEVFEMSEGDFFSTKLNGGTMVSPALVHINKIVKERYDPAHTNIYISHASDGDNYSSDSSDVKKAMSGSGSLMNKIQYFSYVEVGASSQGWLSLSSSKTKTSLWESYDEIQSGMPKKMSMAIIENPESCYEVFKKIFKKK